VSLNTVSLGWKGPMTTNTLNLLRWAGLSAFMAGLLFVVIQLIHPPEALASVATTTWVVVHILSVAMCVLWLFGITGLYARQVNAVGWLGLTGFLLTSVWLVLTAAFTFAEALILPTLATSAPAFVEGFLGIAGGPANAASVGALSTVYSASGVLYLLGGVLFGVATFRAGILPRWAAVLFAVGTVLPAVLSSFVPIEFLRATAVPVGLALAWLGFGLWSERRATAAQPLPRLTPRPAAE
jgi:hypothetical protein